MQASDTEVIILNWGPGWNPGILYFTTHMLNLLSALAPKRGLIINTYLLYLSPTGNYY